MKRTGSMRMLLAAVLAFALGSITAPAAQNVTNHGVVWAVSYDADFLPNNGSSDPAWSTLSIGSGSSASVSGGILTLTNMTSTAYAEMNNLTYWNGGSDGTYENTIEFRVRGQNAQANANWTGRLFWGDGQHRWFFSFDDNRLQINSSALHSLDTTAFHTYRIVSSNGVADLYIDNIGNQATPVLSGVLGQVVAQNFLFIGHDGATLKGRTEWDFVRWTNAGAFTVPEPGVLGLTAIAGLFATLVSRRRR